MTVPGHDHDRAREGANSSARHMPGTTLLAVTVLALSASCGDDRGPVRDAARSCDSSTRDAGKDAARDAAGSGQDARQIAWDAETPDARLTADGSARSDASIPREVVYTWDPMIRHECYSLMDDPPQWVGPPMGPDCVGSNPKRWIFGTTNEDASFSGGGSHDVPIGDPVWTFAFHPTGQGTYQVGWVLDKINYPEYRNRYTYAGFVDSWDFNGPPRPDLSLDVVAELDLALMAEELEEDVEAGPAKARVLVGAVARWGRPERSHYLEVNLWRSDSFDLCTPQECVGGNCCPPLPCDTLGVYDRRFECDPTQGWPAGVYFYGPALDLVGLTPLPVFRADGRMRHVAVPLGRLFRAYSWTDPPADWHGVTLAGVYIGLEVWGAGRVWVEFRNYRCFAALP